MPDLATSITRPAPPLLAHIDPFAHGPLETRLIYPSHAPQGLADKIKLFFLKPLMTLAARNEVKAFLLNEDISGLESAKKLLSDIRKDPFRSVSETELSEVLADASLHKISISGNFSQLVESHFKDPDHLEQAFHQLLPPLNKTEARALTSFIAFVRDPSSLLDRRDRRAIDLLLQKMYAMEPPTALLGVLGSYQEDYWQAYENAANTGIGFREIGNKSELTSACDELHDRFPLHERECIQTFEKFTANSSISDTNRASLQRFMIQFSHHYAKLSRDTIISLLPAVIAVEDALEGKALLEKFILPEEKPAAEVNLASELLFRVRNGSSYSPSATLALIEYISIKSRIKRLESALARTESLLSRATEQKSSQLEKHKLAALRKKRLPGKQTKKNVLAYKGVWASSTKGAEEKRAELSSLKNRLINPESRVRLAYVVSHPDLLLQSLPSIGEKSRETAKRVLEELRIDLIDYGRNEAARPRHSAPHSSA